MVPALVLTAGLGTRVRPLSFVRAKGALPVAGEPLARRILRWLRSGGVTDAVLNLHHLPHTLTAVIGNGDDIGVRVRYSWEVPVLGSAGGPRRALPLLAAPTFFVVNGDTLTNVDLAGLLASHRASDALVTIAVIPNREPAKYSGLAVDSEGRMTGIVPRGSSAPSFHFIGPQVVEARALASVPPDTPYESVGTLYPALIAERLGSVRVYRTEADFLDIGTAADYFETCMLMAQREGRDGYVGARAELAADARIERSVLWDDVVVEAGAMVKECVVTDGVRVPADTSWHGVTLRRPDGNLADGERVIGNLAVRSL
jgi:NDP-sugar pyrophosphorylase family protein